MTSAPQSSEPSSSADRNAGPVSIFVVSDSSGETAAHVTHAALAQFHSHIVTLKRYPQIRDSLQLQEVVREAARGEALIAFTLVLPEFREVLLREARQWNVETFDLLGPLIAKISQMTHTTPMSMPGRLHLLDDAYFRRMEAVNFAVHLDDGTHPDRLHEADVILVGLSRSSKTPNCLYLAQHYGLKSANVPLVMGIPPPQALYEVNPRKVFGLAIDPHILHGLRTSRAQVMGMEQNRAYSSIEELVEEVKFARKIFRDLKCQVIDVSTRAIEETSSEIAIRLSRNSELPPQGGKV